MSNKKIITHYTAVCGEQTKLVKFLHRRQFMGSTKDAEFYDLYQVLKEDGLPIKGWKYLYGSDLKDYKLTATEV